MEEEELYVRYYVGHQGKFGHEFLQFEFCPDGVLRYANNSKYKRDALIKKEARVSSAVMEEVLRMILESGILEEDDAKWPEPDRIGKQTLEVKCKHGHICFETTKIGTLQDISQSEDPEGLKTFFYLAQDLKCLVLSLIRMHFKVRPI